MHRSVVLTDRYRQVGATSCARILRSHSALARVIRLTRDKDYRLAASFHAIPLDDLAAFIELLRAQLGDK